MQQLTTESISSSIRVEHISTLIVLAASQCRCMVNKICCIYSNCLLMMNSSSIQTCSG